MGCNLKHSKFTGTWGLAIDRASSICFGFDVIIERKVDTLLPLDTPLAQELQLIFICVGQGIQLRTV